MKAVRELVSGKTRIILKVKSSGEDKVLDAMAVIMGPKYERKDKK